MAGNSLVALNVATPQNNTLDAFAAGATNASNLQNAELERARQTVETIAQASFGVLDGNLDGQADPEEWEQTLDMFEQGGLPVAGFRGRPELANVVARSSADVLEQARDERQFQFALDKWGAEMEAAAAERAAGPKPTSDMVEYEAAKKEGFTGTLQDWITQGKKAGATTVNVGQGSTPYNKKLDEGYAQVYQDLQSEARSGQRALNAFQAMETNLSDPNFYSGAGGDQILQLKRVAATVGIDPEGVTSMETFNALSKQAALDVMGGSLGTGFSNADRDFVIDQVANLGNTPEGNRKIIALQSKLAERKIEIAAFATEYAQKHGQIDAGFDAALRAWAEENPLFPNADSDNGEERTTANGITYSIGG